ncbi:peptide-methionine (R)-S-oxide reductase MsrB [Sphingobium sp. DC-2]|uniref:peptide-methionine (R)-S-oxide reductase MsrB n=1 Tax=Sphingobium sp. DC-2 TaxID=1303256 RepID=UPI0004C3749C|nr:peptide-methionine (R)-S-oxide reductase MsrB [Sphingobium sp. DC-2]
MNRRTLLSGGLYGIAAIGLWRLGAGDAAAAAYPFSLSDGEWRKRLSPLAYDVLRKHATERPFTSPLNKEHRSGVFSCAGCGHPLFRSATKFDSGTGWPSFWAPLPRAVGTSRDFTLGIPRTEVHCARCGGHLGHVFDDGPRPTGKRYCMNGVALSFSPA